MRPPPADPASPLHDIAEARRLLEEPPRARGSAWLTLAAAAMAAASGLGVGAAVFVGASLAPAAQAGPP